MAPAQLFRRKYMQDHGYRIIPVNPNYDEVLGEKSYPALTALGSLAEPVGIVDCFRKAAENGTDCPRRGRHPCQGALDAARHPE